MEKASAKRFVWQPSHQYLRFEGCSLKAKLVLLCETHHRLGSGLLHLHPPPSLRLKSIPWQPSPLCKFVDPPTSYVFHRQLGEGGKDDGSFTVSSTKLEYSTSGSIGRHIVLSPDVVRALRFSMGLFLSIRPLLLFYQTQTNLEREMFY